MKEFFRRLLGQPEVLNSERSAALNFRTILSFENLTPEEINTWVKWRSVLVDRQNKIVFNSSDLGIVQFPFLLPSDKIDQFNKIFPPNHYLDREGAVWITGFDAPDRETYYIDFIWPDKKAYIFYEFTKNSVYGKSVATFHEGFNFFPIALPQMKIISEALLKAAKNYSQNVSRTEKWLKEITEELAKN